MGTTAGETPTGRGCLVDGLGDWTTGFTVNTVFSCTFFLGAGKGGGVLGPTVLLF